ncbi:MAG: FecR domain-containing protein [Chitinophagaceae bacterium]
MLFKDLLRRYTTDELSVQETNEFFRLLEDPENQLLLDEEIGTHWREGLVVASAAAQAAQSVARLRGIIYKTGTEVPAREKPVRRIPVRYWWAAAAVLLLVSAGSYLWFSGKKNPPRAISEAKKAEIQPGRNGAVLTLADGSQVSLDSVKDGMIALQGGVTARVVNGQLVYEGTGNEVVYNTISTPKGRQFHLTLPDGTAVWLNSASSIRYPTFFKGDRRGVQLTGEAYFDVAKNKAMPFRVNVNDKTEVEVTGTQFNVNAYDNEETVNTTLVEGSVSVNAYPPALTIADQASLVLKPGQQAQVKNGATGQAVLKLIEKADLEKVLAWKNGLFYFEGASLREIMRQVERWYDVSVVFKKDNLEKGEFVGEMTRGITLNQLLVSLEELGVHTRLEGRTLFILP